MSDKVEAAKAAVLERYPNACCPAGVAVWRTRGESHADDVLGPLGKDWEDAAAKLAAVPASPAEQPETEGQGEVGMPMWFHSTDHGFVYRRGEVDAYVRYLKAELAALRAPQTQMGENGLPDMDLTAEDLAVGAAITNTHLLDHEAMVRAYRELTAMFTCRERQLRAALSRQSPNAGQSGEAVEDGRAAFNQWVEGKMPLGCSRPVSELLWEAWNQGGSKCL